MISNRFLLKTSGCITKLHCVFHSECTNEDRTHADVGHGIFKNPENNTESILTRKSPMVNIDTGYCKISFSSCDLPVHNENKKGFAMKRSGLYATSGLSNSFFLGKPEHAYTFDDAAARYTLVHISGMPDSLIARATG